MSAKGFSFVFYFKFPNAWNKFIIMVKSVAKIINDATILDELFWPPFIPLRSCSVRLFDSRIFIDPYQFNLFTIFNWQVGNLIDDTEVNANFCR